MTTRSDGENICYAQPKQRFLSSRVAKLLIVIAFVFGLVSLAVVVMAQDALAAGLKKPSVGFEIVVSVVSFSSTSLLASGVGLFSSKRWTPLFFLAICAAAEDVIALLALVLWWRNWGTV